MAEDTKEGTAGAITVGTLREMISGMVGDAVKGLTGGDKTPDKPADASKTVGGSPDVASAVQAELARLKAREDRDRRDSEIDATLKTLQEKTADKPPVERRRVHKLMGWGE